MLAALKERPGLVVGLGLTVLVVVTGGGFLLAQSRVYERPPSPPEHEAMITLEDLIGQAPEGTGSAEELVRVFPSMPMLWLNYRRGGPVQIRSHLLRYDDEDLASDGVERFAAGDSQWVAGLDMEPLALPSCLDSGSLQATVTTDGEGSGFLLTARQAGSYVHVSGAGWAPATAEGLASGICPSLTALQSLPFPPAR